MKIFLPLVSPSSSFPLVKLAKRISLLLLLLEVQLVAGHQPVAAQGTAPITVEEARDTAKTICPADLKEAIDAIANRSEFRYARWGILIQSLSSGATLYSRDAQQYFIPASNVKLLTTAAALSQLGADFRIRTSVYGADLSTVRVVGRGDPSLSNEQLEDLVQQLKRHGIRQIERLIVEDGYFSEPTINPTWEWEDVFAYYGAPVNSLILNQNAALLTLSPQTLGRPLQLTWVDPIAAVQWQIENDTLTSEAGSSASIEISGILGKPLLRITGQLGVDAEPMPQAVAILDPAAYFLEHFRRILGTAGITVLQASVVSESHSGSEPELAAVESPPLSTLAVETNQQSNNLYAEALLRSLGATQPVSEASTAEAGLQQVKASLTALGVDPESYVQADGSGLSRRNLVSPLALVQTLQAMAKTPVAAIYRASLPVAGVSGSLQNRFRATPAQGVLQAKTGTMTGVVALSGYLDVPGYQPLVFSILVNQSNQPVPTLRQAIDEIALLLTQLRFC
ncbi:MAG TPA: D-alanyl-D-alanine carboxypeptidase/D-alanyl-D-alanine-endopeptidase [Cyanobacteria bacterium UBA8803]|nr:D-alanyl-D-alanine carboxypeptidase/D-alanyl-D-alanine-endopeptidase [Cyanobacteria bacterium UBA9273]HBL57067.1 D-alanyl-D-alanine carboxypeptidase/D-alanyl-D-alanine-endopeptidase [Cyanobacteria bacterium UBA8803]